MTMADTKVYIAIIANAKAISKADMLLFLSLRLVYTFFRIGTMSKQSTMLKNIKSAGFMEFINEHNTEINIRTIYHQRL